MKHAKRFIALLLVVVVGMSAVYSQDKPSHRISFDPSLIYQHVYYKDSKYDDIKAIGVGMGLDYAYRLGRTTEMGLGLSTEFFVYEGFFDYLDLKMAAKVRQEFFSIGDEPFFAFYADGGVGADFLTRSDGKVDLYPLVLAGVAMDVFTGNRHSDPFIGFKLDVQGTFQGGSTVLHVLGGIEVSFAFGGPDGGAR